MPQIKSLFRNFSHRVAEAVGSPWAFLAGVAVTIIWGATGPMFHYSDTWQLVINTGTTIVTFLMVFLIQSTQNRDSKALHLKLDELIRAVGSARNRLVNLESCTDEEISALEKSFSACESAPGIRPSLPKRPGRSSDCLSQLSRSSIRTLATFVLLILH
jgi:low affinity Fe/Cu permease